jgi:hypothetical protein
MNTPEWDEMAKRTSDRMPHSGWAAFGPYRDRRADFAYRVVFWVCIISVVAVLFIPN